MSIHEMGGVEAPADTAHGRHANSPYEPVFVGARRQELDELLTRYPTKMAALLPALWMVQQDRGWVSDEAMAEAYLSAAHGPTRGGRLASALRLGGILMRRGGNRGGGAR